MGITISNEMLIKEVILEKTQLYCTKLIDVSVSPSDVAMMLLYDMHSYVLSEQLDNIKREYKHPADWWQAFKQQWFLSFMLKKWPVKMKKHIIDIDFKAMYPRLTAKISIPDEQSVLKYVVREETSPDCLIISKGA